ncbi:MAG: PIN domain-containing protein [Symploca sp. SIO1B1]|nr:PIN domain-containing protein [Symploca sp. SIO1B1]
MASNFTALYDACVLYSAPLRDLLMQLALTDLFRARWTEQIQDEWIESLLKKRPDLKLEQLTRTKELMNRNVRDCLVTDYEYLIPSLELPDPDDCHVLAAAIKGGADVIVTFNLSDFPQATLDQYDIEAQHPDNFICDLIDLKPTKMITAVKICQQRLRNPPKSINEYLDTLLRQGLTLSVSTLRELYDES